MGRKFSGKVFDRAPTSRAASGMITTDLTRICHHADPGERALGVNVECDWRVTPNREDYFFRSALEGLSPAERPEGIREMLQGFYRKHIRGVSQPDFLLDHNQDRRCVGMNDSTSLVNVFRVPESDAFVEPGAIALSLGGILRSSEAADVLREVFPEVSSGYSSTRRMELEDRQREFLSACLSRGGKPVFHPVWVGLQDEVGPFVEMGPEQWLATFGLRSYGPRLCLLFQYQVQALKGLPLFMPTYLDSCCCDDHFPGPASRCGWRDGGDDRPIGGHPVSLDLKTDVGPLPQEFIHEDIQRSPDMVFAWGWTQNTASEKGIERARVDHYDRLGRYYSDLGEWLQDPI